MSVSDDAIITDAASPAALSGPADPKMSASIAVDAAPETGLIKRKGASPSGIPSRVSNPPSASVMPHAVNIETAQNSTQSVGNKPMAELNPFFAPPINDSNRGFFDTSIKPPHKAIIAGTIDEMIASGFKPLISSSNFHFS